VTKPTLPVPALLAAVLLTLIVLLPGAFAEDHAQSPPPPSAEAQTTTPETKPAPEVKPEVPPPSAVTQHSIKLGDETLSYTAEIGALPLRDAQGIVTANIYYVAYTRDPKDAKRPVSFVFNGGPGAASAYLNLGALGPRVVDTTTNGELLGPPPRLIDNDQTWLDLTDLVFIDPVGTGFSRATKDEDKFFGVKQDTEALSEFVRLFLIKFGRMVSPVYFVGESYGGFRAANLTHSLQKSGILSPSGMILISPALEFALLNTDDYDPLAWALSLPSLAAVNFEQQGITGRDALAMALKDVERYALSDYLVALASGNKEGGKAASKTVAKLIGLPLDIVEQQNARITPHLFMKEFDRANGQVLSRYDGSVSGPDPNPASAWPNGPDPVLDATAPLWTAAFVFYAESELNLKTDTSYKLLNREVRNKWDFGTSPTRQGYAGVIDDIQEARAANPNLAIMIASGYTDLITPYFVPSYLVGQLPELQGARPITVENYAGGHMLYTRPDSRRDLRKDVEAVYRPSAKPLTSSEGLGEGPKDEATPLIR
jgi:carboxypeptidase C (cathepsin A)